MATGEEEGVPPRAWAAAAEGHDLRVDECPGDLWERGLALRVLAGVCFRDASVIFVLFHVLSSGLGEVCFRIFVKFLCCFGL